MCSRGDNDFAMTYLLLVLRNKLKIYNYVWFLKQNLSFKVPLGKLFILLWPNKVMKNWHLQNISMM